MIESPVLPSRPTAYYHGEEQTSVAVSSVGRYPSPFRLGWPNLFSILMAVILSANYFSIMTDLDWSWQIRTGELIVQTGDLRPPEAFSYTINGSKVHDFEWLYEVVLYYVWSFLGIGGLKFLKMVLVILPLVLLGWRLRSQGVRWHAVVVSLFVAGWIVSTVWNLRALYCTTIGLLLVSGWLQDHCVGRKPLTWWLPVVMLLWSNLHPGVITGQGLLLGAIGLEWANRWVKFNSPLSWSQLKRLTLIAGLGFLATFVSPDPIDRLLYPFRPELKHAIQSQFVEMNPLYAFVYQLPSVVGATYVLAVCVLIALVYRARQFRMWEYCLLAGLALLANLAVRCLMDWTLIMLALAVPKMGSLLVDAARSRQQSVICWVCLLSDRFWRRMMDNRFFRFQPAWLLSMAGVFLVISLIPPLANRLPVQESTDWPLAPMEFAAQEGLHGNFFATPYHAAWIGWRLKEKGRVYTDTRGFFFPPERLEDSLFIPSMSEDWRERLNRVLDEKGDKETNYFLLHTDSALWKELKPHIDEPKYLKEPWVLLSAEQVRCAAYERRLRLSAG